MRLASSLAILALLLVLPVSDLSASGLGHRKFELDFTKGDAIASRVAWSPAE